MPYAVTDNPYFNPEKSNLKLVGELEFSDQSYCFDTRVVWQSEDGRLWTARDSGCSCPTPFENTTELDRCWVSDLEDEYRHEASLGYAHVTVAQWEEFIRKVEEARKTSPEVRQRQSE